ncbi:hypothetical protein TNCV_2362831 [Trichonephila clavipes]|nr:hypothetical protein TNCV_2362831 [Trichonephila clavipes]
MLEFSKKDLEFSIHQWFLESTISWTSPVGLGGLVKTLLCVHSYIQGVPKCRVQTDRGGRQHREEPPYI